MIKSRMPYVIVMSGLLTGCASYSDDSGLADDTRSPIVLDKRIDTQTHTTPDERKFRDKIIWLDGPPWVPIMDSSKNEEPYKFE